MEKVVQQIYCDETGTTGNNLLNPDQALFAYASVAITHEEARDFTDRAKKDFRIQAPELKAVNLLKYNKGRRAVTQMLAQYHEQILVSVYDKKYSLACKLFEYIFEPAIAASSSIYYGIGFHKFVASLLYLNFRAKARYAEEIFEDFERMMRELSVDSATHLFGAVLLPNREDRILDLVRRFCVHNRRSILAELDVLRGPGIGKWILDLAGSALFDHLAIWGSKYPQIDVYCDETKTLEGFDYLFDVMLGREEKIFRDFDGHQHPLTFNLLKEISSVRSIDCPGVQLADIAAGAVVFALQNRDDEQAKKWAEYFPEMMQPPSVLPDFESIDVADMTAQRNILLLHEIVDRSEKGLSLTEGIGEFLIEMTSALRARPLWSPSIVQSGR